MSRARVLAGDPPVFVVPQRLRRYCCGLISLGGVPIYKRDERKRQAAAKGIPLEHCGLVATHEIDGEPYCPRHAGTRALEILLAEPERAER